MDVVEVTAAARLHMGFFDLNGGLGRKFGSIGVSLDQPVTRLCAWPSHGFSAKGPDATRAVQIASRLAEALKLQQGLHIEVQQAIPQHAGLGAGTQLSLAVGMAMSRLFGLGLSAADIALLTQRGARSGIGIGTFMHGGVIVDGGRSPGTGVPPVIASMAFPEAWRIILIFDRQSTGVHGGAELEAFGKLPQFSAEDAATLCRHVLMQALPALAEQDLQAFGAAIRVLQEKTGDHFAPVQGGRYASARVAEALAWLQSEEIGCLGQSSWGPTGFAIFENASQAESYLSRLRPEFPALEFMLCRGRNESGSVHKTENKRLSKV
jgi:beta-ribofuranosylaminobenzene 5'-phosphate synthase